jgi:HEAT repeat protein
MIAAEKLGRAESAAAVPALAKALGDSDATVQKAAAKALARIGAPAFVPVTGALANSGKDSKLAKLGILKSVGDRAAKGDWPDSALDPIVGCLSDESAPMRIEAAAVLGALGARAKSALPALRTAAADPTPFDEKWMRAGGSNSVSQAALEAVLAIDPKAQQDLAKEIVPKLEKALLDAIEKKQSNRAAAAAGTIGRLGSDAAFAEKTLEAAVAKAGTREGSRYAIEAALKSVQGERATALALKKLQDPDTPAKDKAALLNSLIYRTRLSDAPGYVKVVEDAMNDKNVQVRIAAIRVAAYLEPKEREALVPALLARLGDKEIMEAPGLEARSKVPAILGRCGSDVVPALEEILTGPSDSLRRFETVEVLARLGPKAAAAKSTLKRILDRTSNLAVAMMALQGYLAADGDPADVEERLRAGFSHDEPYVRTLALGAAESSPFLLKKLQKEIAALLDDKDREVRITAAHALAHLGDGAKPYVPALAARLTSRDNRERFQMTQVIDKLGATAADAAPQLAKQLDKLENGSPNPTLTALIKLGPASKPAIPRLLELARSTDSMVQFQRSQIVEALGAAGADLADLLPLVKPGLTTAENKTYEAQAALRAFGWLGPAAKPAEIEIRKMLVHPSYDVRIWAHAALARIEPAQAASHVQEIIEYWKDDRALGARIGGCSYNAAQALALTGAAAQPAKDLLAVVVHDPKTPAGIRARSLEALQQCGLDPAEMATLLIPLLGRVEGPDHLWPSDLEQICQILADCGPKARKAVPHLEKLRTLGEPEVTVAATHALARIQTR